MTDGNDGMDKRSQSSVGNSSRGIINCNICRPEPKAVITLELRQPCGICGYIASHDTTYIDKHGEEVHQYLCNDCAPELAKNFKFISVKEI